MMFGAMQRVVTAGKSRAKPALLSAFVRHSSAASDSHERLAGKVVVITGVASGIGKATAAEFFSNGAKVILADEAKYVNGHNLVVDGGYTVTKATPSS